METTLDIDTPELDALQARYQDRVTDWIAAIRSEAALAAHPHEIAEVDSWEAAYFRQDKLRAEVASAKEAYEAGLRKKFYQI